MYLDEAVARGTLNDWQRAATEAVDRMIQEGVDFSEFQKYFRLIYKQLCSEKYHLTAEQTARLAGLTSRSISTFDKDVREAGKHAEVGQRRFYRNGEHLLWTFLRKLPSEQSSFTLKDVIQLTDLNVNDGGALIALGVALKTFKDHHDKGRYS